MSAKEDIASAVEDTRKNSLNVTQTSSNTTDSSNSQKKEDIKVTELSSTADQKQMTVGDGETNGQETTPDGKTPEENASPAKKPFEVKKNMEDPDWGHFDDEKFKITDGDIIEFLMKEVILEATSWGLNKIAGVGGILLYETATGFHKHVVKPLGQAAWDTAKDLVLGTGKKCPDVDTAVRDWWKKEGKPEIIRYEQFLDVTSKNNAETAKRIQDGIARSKQTQEKIKEVLSSENTRQLIGAITNLDFKIEGDKVISPTGKEYNDAALLKHFGFSLETISKMQEDANLRRLDSMKQQLGDKFSQEEIKKFYFDNIKDRKAEEVPAEP